MQKKPCFCRVFFYFYLLVIRSKLWAVLDMTFLYSCEAFGLCLNSTCTSTASILPICAEKPRPKLLCKAKLQAPHSHSHMLSKAQPPTTHMLEIAMHKAKYGLCTTQKKGPASAESSSIFIYLLFSLSFGLC